MRAFGMFMVFSFHVGMYLNPWPWHVKAEPVWPSVATFNLLFLPWGMPLFFVISGLSARLSLAGRGTGGFAGERLIRLGPPLLLGILLLSPPQVWVERSTQGAFAGSFWEFLPHYFAGFYPAGNFAWMGLHLWYLLLLLAISVAALPVLRAPTSGPGLWGRALARGTWPGVVAAPILTIAMASLAAEVLGVSFGQGGWPVIIYPVFYLLGLNLVPLPAFRGALLQVGPWLLAGAVATSLPIALLPEQPFAFTVREVLFQLDRMANGWLWICALLWLGERFCNRGGPTLRYINEAVLPFYILHQPVIVAFGYLWRTAPWPGPLKFLAVAVAAFFVIMAVYHTLVRPFNNIRFWLGLRPRRAA